ncbi:MAG: heavy metal translocating P-type ATPase [Arenicellales bacterium]
MTECFHCGLPVPAGVRLSVAIDGRERPMCCHGCEAVAQTIVDAGYSNFYTRRSTKPMTRVEAVPDFLRAASAYDDDAVASEYVRAETKDGGRKDSLKHVSLLIDGISCAACAWLIERRLKETPGVIEAHVNYSTHRAMLSWIPGKARLSDIIERVRSIGYRAQPYNPAVHEEIARREDRSYLLRIGISGALGMQVMMIATAMYFGDSGGIEEGYRTLFRWLGLFLTAPVIVYCALPFFRGAVRDARNGTLGMDVPVTLGLVIAFAGSARATWTGAGSVYYDSIVMFVFFLLCARYLENRARHRSVAAVEALNQALPDLAERRRGDGQWERVPGTRLSPGDIIRVRAGGGFPADGTIREGATSANESLLTGEPTPVEKPVGSAVLAGSVNIDQPVIVEVTSARGGSILSQIIRMTERAQTHKPRLARAADHASAWFVASVVLLAASAGVYWSVHGDADWVAVVVSILVVSCPCALSLATPAALTSAVNALTRRSIIPVSGAALETLARIDTVVLDKTGTLTEGRLSVTDIVSPTGVSAVRVLRIAAALNQSSHHPVGRAIVARFGGIPPPVAQPHRDAGGVDGIVDGKRYYLGNAAYITARTAARPGSDGPGTCAWLADDERILGRMDLEDRVRPDAQDMLRELSRAGLHPRLFSGDRSPAVEKLARRLGISDFEGDMSPSRKLAALQALQGQGHRVAALGDGINDAPFLSAADVSISMARGADLARVNADLVLMGDCLDAVPEALRIARRVRTVIRQNIAWAVGYNLVALPAATLGMVPPWLAAIGMSLSSLVVVSNALRLNLRRPEPRSPVRGALVPAAG